MEKKLTSGDFFWTFIRSNFLQGSWNMERMQALGYCFGMVPILKRLYEGEELKQAIKRHLEFYNTQPFVTAPIIGITAALEEQKANGKDISDGVINGIKVGMMGPLAGVGDPIFWGTWRPITAALGASFATSGSLIGPLLFFFAFNIVRLGIRWAGIQYGYSKGTDVVKDAAGNKLQKLTEGASILGLFVIGALINQWTSMYTPIAFKSYENMKGDIVTPTLQGTLDSLMPGLMPLILCFVCMYLMKHKVNPIWIIFGLFALGIFGYWTGILAVKPA